MAQFPAGYKFPIFDANGNATSTVVDTADMFVRKELFLNAGLWTCGYNTKGQLGNGSGGASVSYSSPIQVGSLTNWKQISCGYTAWIAVKIDGTVWAGWSIVLVMYFNEE